MKDLQRCSLYGNLAGESVVPEQVRRPTLLALALRFDGVVGVKKKVYSPTSPQWSPGSRSRWSPRLSHPSDAARGTGKTVGVKKKRGEKAFYSEKAFHWHVANET